MRHALSLAALLALPGTQATAQTPGEPWPDGAANRPEVTPAFAAQTRAPAQVTNPAPALSMVSDGLDSPWAIEVLPDDAGYLVTERGGDLHHISRDGRVSAPFTGVPEVVAERQGGLLDLALAPDFSDSRVIYLTFAAPTGGGQSATAAVSATLSPDMTRLDDVTEIFRQTPPDATPGHFGSRVVPLPDGTLVITTGDRMRHAARAQDRATSYGAVIRVGPDGSPPPDNPFLEVAGALPELYSHGHRNLQGAAVDPATGRLWTLEHGPAGGDELNLIVPGGNYGWPVASYGVNYNGSEIGDGRADHAPDFTAPRYYWDPVIAPGGMVFYDGAMFPDWQGDILAAGLIAQAVVRLDLDGDVVAGEERLAEGVGRVRDIAIDDDGSILFVTDEGGASRLMRLSR
ncbi:PQQ-dependent sugar dehydrogenase [Roseicyclus mahoneyensis]|uniref:Glucose/arabinose dehydrogenase n=1 Tax=Roseicyclus mahoneyensis TaxID=164332 RepID=A0A316GP58_9RHOB|nr:PQQ-dependent sugar dehydrogenase [Roseicyclus mahoneyensis]PWK62141.1 glucose/arabinose dehydrogenase [Roseicyclus mahoneyensis]